MLVNQYRMTSVITGEVITGTRSQLMEMGIDADANKKEKMRNWCDMCHNQHDCEDKEEFLDSECESCFQYA